MKQSKTTVRLNKYLADCGVASRRRAEMLIVSGAVHINGHKVTELGTKVNPTDHVTVDGKPVRPASLRLYVAFNKPENVLTSMSDPEGRPTVADYMEQLPVRVYPVGRLDWDTEGLLLLTNDGDFAQKVMHPKSEIPKTYLAKLDGQPSDEQLSKLMRGVTIPGGHVKAIHVERAKVGHSEQYDWVKIIIGEGKNRQVRYMFQKIGYDVKKLKRVAIGQLTLGPLQKGEYAFLDEGGIRKIFAIRREEREGRRAGGGKKQAKARAAAGGGAGRASGNGRKFSGGKFSGKGASRTSSDGARKFSGSSNRGGRTSNDGRSSGSASGRTSGGRSSRSTRG